MCDTPRLFLPLETLENLVCTECKEYLKCGPIKVKLDGDSVCGQCATLPEQNAPLIHHKAFEEIAKLVAFPCKYRNLGCTQYIPFDDTTNHEELCVFHTYFCPADFLSCTWNGTISQLPRHFYKNHLQLFMSTPTFEMELGNTTQETKVYLQENMAFLVRFNVSKEEGKFWVKIEHQHQFQTPITYKLSFHVAEEDGLRMVMKEKTVSYVPSSSSVFGIKDAQCVDINSLLTILENPSQIFCSIDLKIPVDITKEIQLKLEEVKCPHCLSYMAPPIFICSEGHNSCEDCTGYNKKCKLCNKENSTFIRNTILETSSASLLLPCRWRPCEEVLDYSTVRIHEKTCKHKVYKCPRCYRWYGTHKKLCDHFSSEHETHPLHINKTITIRGEIKVYDFYMLAYGDIFGCSLFPTAENGKNFSLWYYGLPTFYDNYEYYVRMRRKTDESEDLEVYKLEKCCATENCFSYNIKIPNEDIDKYENCDDLYFIFDIVEKS